MATLHTDIPSRSEVERLLGVRDPDEACVSIYVATTPVTQEAEASRIELKNLVADALGQVESAGAGSRVVTELREPLEDLVEDDGFWAEQARSLAVFAAPGLLRTFRLPNRLGSAVEVGDRFHVKPLLRAVTFPQTAFVLALAAGGVRLVEVTRDGPAFTVPVPGLPTDAASAVGKASIDDRSQIGRMQGSEGQKVRLRQYVRKVDQALRGVLTGLELPLILAAAEPIASIYRAQCTYPHLVEAALPGNPEEHSDEQLPGTVDETTGVVALSDDDDAASYGVVDEIARRVLHSGGRVLAVRADEVPGGGPVAGLLRYELAG